MGNILVFLQHNDGVLAKSSLIALSAAREIKSSWGKDGFIGLCLGKNSSVAADQALGYGFGTVYFSEDPSLEKYLVIPYLAALKTAFEAGGCDTGVCSATSTGKDLFPRAAAVFDAGQASDIVGINDDGSLRRPMYAGDVLADVEILTETKFVTVRGTAFSPAEEGNSGGEKKELSFSVEQDDAGEVVSYELSGGDRPELTDADVVVSGGRALGDSSKFEEYIFPLADALGAAVGASRAAVDSGYAPNDWQVGQTGKIVAPDLYIAVGISGAIQHLAGMKDSKTIVAINKDPEAPIYEIADYGLVADLFDVLPELTEEIKKIKSQ